MLVEFLYILQLSKYIFTVHSYKVYPTDQSGNRGNAQQNRVDYVVFMKRFNL